MRSSTDYKFLTAKDIPQGFEVRNDMIDDVRLELYRGFALSLGIEYKSGQQGVFYGHHNTANIGYMLTTLARLFGIDNAEQVELIKAFKGIPIRVAFKEDWGGIVTSCTYLGHFMEDKWCYCADLVKFGIPKEEVRDGE